MKEKVVNVPSPGHKSRLNDKEEKQMFVKACSSRRWVSKTEIRATNSGETNRMKEKNHTSIQIPKRLTKKKVSTSDSTQRARNSFRSVDLTVFFSSSFLSFDASRTYKRKRWFGMGGKCEREVFVLFFSFDAATAAAAVAAATLLTVCFCATCWPHVNFTEQNTHQSWICQTIRLSFRTVC